GRALPRATPGAMIGAVRTPSGVSMVAATGAPPALAQTGSAPAGAGFAAFPSAPTAVTSVMTAPIPLSVPVAAPAARALWVLPLAATLVVLAVGGAGAWWFLSKIEEAAPAGPTHVLMQPDEVPGDGDSAGEGHAGARLGAMPPGGPDGNAPPAAGPAATATATATATAAAAATPPHAPAPGGARDETVSHTKKVDGHGASTAAAAAAARAPAAGSTAAPGPLESARPGTAALHAAAPTAVPAPGAAVSTTTGGSAPRPAAAPGSAGSTVHLNAAAQSELESLPGIGPVKARAIMEYRDAHGGFKSVDELLKVKGIGPKTMETLRPRVSL
ncbi:MAG TPA: helix-hairpin-helix domain-containing protein, partial [Myxococcota bacterium]|nr:helix-hairpin-helix domain-containing protein [Myxococcota bacterium]